MTFSTEWDKQYGEAKQLSIWPWSDLVSYVKRYCQITPATKVLELGCGAGANIPFFLAHEVDYYAIEGSEAAVNALLERYPSLEGKLSCSDFTQEIPFDVNFDLVVDRSSLTHNDEASIIRGLNLIKQKLTREGKFVGIDWFSTQHASFSLPSKIVDRYTRQAYQEGQFKDVGKVHFSDEQHLQELFNECQLKIEMLEHKLIAQQIPEAKSNLASWNLLAVHSA